MTRPCSAVAVLFAVVFAAGVALAEEPGKVPYAAIYRVLQPGLVMNDYPRLRAVQRVESRLPDVASAQIRIWIESVQGRLEIAVDPRGRARFPLTEALLAENPPVYSNQPRGSLNIQVSLEARLPSKDDFPYQQVWEAIEQAQSALDRLGGDYAGAQVQGIEYRFERSGGELLITTADYEQALYADAGGRLVLRAEQRWLRDRARVQVRGKLIAAIPRLRSGP